MSNVLNECPCPSCVGNLGRCSLDNETEIYNCLNCKLITEWVSNDGGVKMAYARQGRKFPKVVKK